MLGCPFEVSLQDRPSFKFGEGRSLKAVSRVKFLTPAMGWHSFYICWAAGFFGRSRPSRSRNTLCSATWKKSTIMEEMALRWNAERMKKWLRTGEEDAEATEETEWTIEPRPLNSNAKIKLLAARTAALFVNLNAALGSLMPTLRGSLGCLEVTIHPKDSFVDYTRLEGYDKEGFAQHGPGDDARSSVIRAALAPTGRDLLPQVMWLPAAAVRFPLGQQFPEQLPTGKTLEQIPHMMMTVHPLWAQEMC